MKKNHYGFDYKWIEDHTEKFHMDVESRVEAYFHIDRDASGKPTNISFSHCRFKLCEDGSGHVTWGPALDVKELGKEFVQSVEARMQEWSANGDLDEEEYRPITYDQAKRITEEVFEKFLSKGGEE